MRNARSICLLWVMLGNHVWLSVSSPTTACDGAEWPAGPNAPAIGRPGRWLECGHDLLYRGRHRSKAAFCAWPDLSAGVDNRNGKQAHARYHPRHFRRKSILQARHFELFDDGSALRMEHCGCAQFEHDDLQGHQRQRADGDIVMTGEFTDQGVLG